MVGECVASLNRSILSVVVVELIMIVVFETVVERYVRYHFFKTHLYE